jgi:hypothetical protein
MLRSTLGQVNKVAATALAKGVVVVLNTTNDNYEIAPASALAAGSYFVTAKAAAAADTKVLVVKKGPVCVTSDGAIGPHNFVTKSTATAGQVVEGTASAAGIIGRYIGKANNNEHDGGVVTAAADGDLIWIDLNGGTS